MQCNAVCKLKTDTNIWERCEGMWMHVTSVVYDKIPLDIIRIAHYSFDKITGQKISLSESLPKDTKCNLNEVEDRFRVNHWILSAQLSLCYDFQLKRMYFRGNMCEWSSFFATIIVLRLVLSFTRDFSSVFGMPHIGFCRADSGLQNLLCRILL